MPSRNSLKKGKSDDSLEEKSLNYVEKMRRSFEMFLPDDKTEFEKEDMIRVFTRGEGGMSHDEAESIASELFEVCRGQHPFMPAASFVLTVSDLQFAACSQTYDSNKDEKMSFDEFRAAFQTIKDFVSE